MAELWTFRVVVGCCGARDKPHAHRDVESFGYYPQGRIDEPGVACWLWQESANDSDGGTYDPDLDNHEWYDKPNRLPATYEFEGRQKVDLRCSCGLNKSMDWTRWTVFLNVCSEIGWTHVQLAWVAAKL